MLQLVQRTKYRDTQKFLVREFKVYFNEKHITTIYARKHGVTMNCKKAGHQVTYASLLDVLDEIEAQLTEE